jgi:DNA processing protein
VTQDPGLASWLQLTLTPGLGGAAIRAMLRQFGCRAGPAQASELAAHAAPSVLDALHSETVRHAVDAALAWVEQPGSTLVTLADATYPRMLLEIRIRRPLYGAAGSTAATLRTRRGGQPQCHRTGCGERQASPRR